MSDFRRGDRVRVISDNVGAGEFGTVGLPRSDSGEHDVTLDDGFTWVYLTSELEPAGD